MIFWFTGLSGAGKTTLAGLVHEELLRQHHRSIVLDGDVIRKGLNKDLMFTREDRLENNRRIAEVAKLMKDAGLIVLVSCISPIEKDRHLNRQICGDESFFEIYIDCPLEVCEERDVKGLYKKARLGLIDHFTGIDSPYEVPQAPDVVIRTYDSDVRDSFQALLDFVLRTQFSFQTVHNSGDL